jgi:hypothetical protein
LRLANIYIVKLEAIDALAQLIAAAGVIASFFYLAAQTRQNTARSALQRNGVACLKRNRLT